jgi:hypothetical protein
MASHKSGFEMTGITTINTTLSLYVPLRTITKNQIHPQDIIPAKDKLTRSLSELRALHNMSIQDLPDELLLLIFQPFAEIREHDDPFESINVPSEETTSNIKSLASCSKVCVKWHTIVEPILYSTLTSPSTLPGYGNASPQATTFLPDQIEYVCASPPNKPVRLFLRTIVNQPHLAQNIKKLVLGSWVDSVRIVRNAPWPLSVRVRAPDPEKRQTYRKALGRLARHRSRNSPTDLLCWLDFVRNAIDRYEESELVLLLLSVPNLRTLYIARMPSTEDWMLVGACGLAVHLNEIRLGSVDQPQHIDLLRLGILMTLPNLVSLTLVNCSVLEHSDLSCPRGRLTHLGLLRCHISRNTFKLLTKHVSNIESFEWIGLPTVQSHLEPDWIDYHDGIARTIFSFLSRQKSTLRSLHLLGDGFAFVSIPRLSFKGFESLERLEIRSQLLHDDSIHLSDQLPQSLRHFRVNQSCSHMSNKLEVMLSSRALPKLEKIEYGPVFAVWMMQLGDELRQMNHQKIEALCAIEGITFVKTMRDKRETGQTGS